MSFTVLRHGYGCDMSIIIFVFVFFSSLIYSNGHDELVEGKITQATQLFSGLEGIKEYFRNNTSALAKNILETFENECFYMDDPELPPENSRKAFIVIEGNHKNSREVVGVRLATMMGGRYMVHPAPCLIKYLDDIPKNTLIRRAYYVLSLFATSFNVKVHLSLGRPVVLNGYWLDQLSFALIQSLSGSELPSVDSEVFKTPKGLLPADLFFYLNLPDDLFRRQATTRSPDNWKSRALKLHEDLKVRLPIVIQDLKGVFRATTDAVYEQVVEHLVTNRDITMRTQQTSFDYTNH